MLNVKLYSPLSIDQCLSILKDQVARKPWYIRYSYYRPCTSRVIGKIDGNNVELEAWFDRFSKRFIGQLSASNGGTILEGNWKRPLWKRLYDSPKFDEDEILSFLHKWAQFERID